MEPGEVPVHGVDCLHPFLFLCSVFWVHPAALCKPVQSGPRQTWWTKPIVKSGNSYFDEYFLDYRKTGWKAVLLLLSFSSSLLFSEGKEKGK